MLKILIEDSEGKSKIAPINPDTDITIGRKEGNSIRLKERNVSRQHARIYQTADGIFIEPVAARYGLKVNSSKIDGPTPLALGDDIKIGDYHLYLQDESQQPAAPVQETDAVLDIDPQFQPRFVVTSSNFAGSEFHITKTRVVIGRAPQCEIQLQNQSVSALHAEIRRNARGDFQIRDLGSSNGTKVNSCDIEEAVRLNSGDIIKLGHVVMRFCAPGDLWSLNFGMADDRSKISLPMILIPGFIIIALLVIVAVYLVMQVNNQAQTPHVVSANTETAIDIKDFSAAIAECQNAMDRGDIESAKISCERATKIDPNNTLTANANKKLLENIDANHALDDVVKSLDEGRCDDARDSLDIIKIGTWAYSRAVEQDYKTQIKQCSCSRLYKNAMSAIENNDITNAELLRDNIREIDPDAPEIARINEAIESKKPARSAGSDRPRHHRERTKANSDSAPKPSSGGGGEDAADLCSKAAKAKILEKNDCKAYRLYKKALKTKGIAADCKRNATDHVNKYKSQCN